jgi:DNA (cytosine-5)-methyltransferase 1
MRIYQKGRGFNKGGEKSISPTITSNSFECNNFVIGSMQKNAYRGTTEGYSPAITAACGMGGGQIPMIGNSLRIRKLTPRECFRLMGVDDADIDKIQASGISNSQQYKCAGNSIVVDTLYHLFRKMFCETENENTQPTLF